MLQFEYYYKKPYFYKKAKRAKRQKPKIRKLHNSSNQTCKSQVCELSTEAHQTKAPFPIIR